MALPVPKIVSFMMCASLSVEIWFYFNKYMQDCIVFERLNCLYTKWNLGWKIETESQDKYYSQ